MKNLHFKDFFWYPDLTSTAGYDVIIQYLNDGKRTCKEVEDFMKARASIEERYAKDLLSLSKKVCGHNEMNTLKRSLDMFKLQTEHVSLSHLQLAQSMREEVRKLEEFKERQKEARKKIEQQMDALHKQRSIQFKRTMDSKKTYEQKCRDKEEADQNMNRNTNTNNTKLVEKLHSKAQQAKLNAEEADRLYQQNVITLGKIRDEWVKEHISACEIFEKQSIERINFLRNTVWTHLNQLSQQCVTSDELHPLCALTTTPVPAEEKHPYTKMQSPPVGTMYEEVRRSLEQCDVLEDIEHFVNLRQTGDKPAAPIAYENFYTGPRSPIGQPPPRMPPPAVRRGPLLDPTQNNRGDSHNSLVEDGNYSVIQY